MNNEMNISNDTLDIAGLEFDVAAAGSAEAGDTQVNNAAIMVVMFNWK